MFGIEDALWRLPALIGAIVFHEYAHARVAFALGDPTPKYQGRLTLNPLAHLDPIGLLMLWLFRFGWAKPVHVNPYYFADRRRGMLLVGLAGPATNVVLAFVAITILLLVPFPYGSPWVRLLLQFRLYNVILAVFNMIPVPPLDGSRILAGLVPAAGADFLDRLERHGWLILILLIWTGAIGMIITPLANGLNASLTLLARMLTGS